MTRFLNRLDRFLLKIGPVALLPHDRILIATSNDAISFQPLPKPCIDVWGNTANQMVYNPFVIALPNGNGFRMYFQGTFQEKGKWLEQIYSAYSKNLLQWTIEPGIRIPNASCPSVQWWPEEKKWLMLFSDRSEVLQLFTSTDGLTWQKESSVDLQMGAILDPHLVRHADIWKIFYSKARGESSRSIDCAQSNNLKHWSIQTVLLPTQPNIHYWGPSLLETNPQRLFFHENKGTPTGSIIRSACLKKNSNWEIEAGVRLQPFPPYAQHGVELPFVLPYQEKYFLFYTGFFGMHLPSFRRKSF